MTGVVKHGIFIDHDTGPSHPESPRRLEVLYDMLQDKDIAGKLKILPPRKASREEIEYNHMPAYFDYVAKTEGVARSSLDMDTQLSSKSFEAALYAAGGVLNSIDALINGECPNVFALVRPPGHHAEANRGMGFCIFNNIAVGAEYAIRHHGINRVLIVDWDLHHGNGTQHSFYSDDRVLYFSIHQYPHYPGTGDVLEVGSGRGRGFTVNVPLGPGYGDYEYIMLFEEVLRPVALLYKPQLVLVSAGFDAHYKDPLGGMEITSEGFSSLADVVMDIAEKTAGRRILLSLEGGYNLEALRESVKKVMVRLFGEGCPGPHQPPDDRRRHDVDMVVKRIADVHSEFWSCF